MCHWFTAASYAPSLAPPTQFPIQPPVFYTSKPPCNTQATYHFITCCAKSAFHEFCFSAAFRYSWIIWGKPYWCEEWGMLLYIYKGQGQLNDLPTNVMWLIMVKFNVSLIHSSFLSPLTSAPYVSYTAQVFYTSKPPCNTGAAYRFVTCCAKSAFHEFCFSATFRYSWIICATWWCDPYWCGEWVSKSCCSAPEEAPYRGELI